jgi:hypothetical protein
MGVLHLSHVKTCKQFCKPLYQHLNYCLTSNVSPIYLAYLGTAHFILSFTAFSIAGDRIFNIKLLLQLFIDIGIITKAFNLKLL